MKLRPEAPLPRRHAMQAMALLCLASPLSRTKAQPAATVNLDTLQAALKNRSAVVFDIREPAEHATGVAAGARLLPMSQIDQRLAEIPKDQPVLLVCNTQNRSTRVADALRQRGWSNVRAVQGGMSAWAQRGLPMVKPVALPAPARP